MPKPILATLAALFAVFMGQLQPAHAGPTLLMEASSGKLLYGEDIDDQWYPASLTKIMTAYLTFEALRAGKLKPDSEVVSSEAAHAQPPSKIGLPVGTTLSLDLALKAVIIKSANDAAVMLAEAIDGNVETFVKRMNATARRLGMSRTNFVNPNGLPAPEQVSTGRDLARLSRAVLRDFPEYASLWTMPDMRLGKIRLRSHNGLLKTYEGADGLKTGFICDSGFNVVATATRDNLKLIAIVLGEPTATDRSIRAASLLEHGFMTYGWKTLFSSRSIDSEPLDSAAKGPVSVRSTVTSWDCGNRRRIRKPPVNRKAAAIKAARRKVATPRKRAGAAKPVVTPTKKPGARAGAVAPKRSEPAVPRK